MALFGFSLVGFMVLNATFNNIFFCKTRQVLRFTRYCIKLYNGG